MAAAHSEKSAANDSSDTMDAEGGLWDILDADQSWPMVEDSDSDEPQTPIDRFFYAILKNDIDEVKVKLSEGESPLTVSPIDGMALHFAVLNSRHEVLKLFHNSMDGSRDYIDTVFVHPEETITGTALHVAMDGQVAPSVARLLIEMGANTETKDSKGSPILHELVKEAWEDSDIAFHWEMTGLRVEASYNAAQQNVKSEEKSEECSATDPNTHTQMTSVDETTNIDGNETVQLRTKRQNKETTGQTRMVGQLYVAKLAILLENGVNVNSVDEERGRMSALHKWCEMFVHCSKRHRTDLANLSWCQVFLSKLLENGANPDLANAKGQTALWFFAQRHFTDEHTEYIEMYRALVKLLLKQTTDLEKRDIFGRRLLHEAADFSNFVLIEEMLKYTVHIEPRDNFGLTPLHLITHNITSSEASMVLRIFTLLTVNGASLDVKDRHGATSVHHAVHLKNTTALRFLLGKGADPTTVDNKGMSVKSQALVEGDCSILTLLNVESVPETRSGVSNSRLGWFYPLCCYKEYSVESDGNGEHSQEKVNVEDVETWANTYPICKHNQLVIVQNSLSTFENNEELRTLTELDKKQIMSDIFTAMERAAELIGRLNPLFQCAVVIGGSVGEETKIGAPDEMDIVFELCKLGDMVTVHEETTVPGYVKLSLKGNYIQLFQEMNLLTEDGFVKRSALSKAFHKLLQQSLNAEEVWKGTCILTESETVDWEGECLDIGQLNILWFGPFKKRQKISLDLVPALRPSGYLPSLLRRDVAFVDNDVIQSVGCFLVMKYALSAMATEMDVDMDELLWESQHEGISDVENLLFKISLSQLEHGVMRHLPPPLKAGYKIAKSVQLQCPFLALPIEIDSDEHNLKEVAEREVQRIEAHFTSYTLKTALFYILHESGTQVSLASDDLEPAVWNRSVLGTDHAASEATVELQEAVQTAAGIYRRLLMWCQNGNHIPEFFLKVKVKPTVASMTSFCYLALRYLEMFQTEEILKDLA